MIEINCPKDLRNHSVEELTGYAAFLRANLLKKLAAHGGHAAPNLGVVEATIALHYVFDAPQDKLVFDVSHQTYIHKMLTGRMQAFTDPAHYDDVTGYTCPRESPYDLFEIGHTSTSISLATGLAKARDLRGGKENVVAFIGDASLGGGQALEALNYAPMLGSNFIVVVNDNQMSIAENHGALYPHLQALRESNGTARNNIFKALGYEYIYVHDGNNIRALIEAFRSAKDAPHAVVVHINTIKGLGYAPAEADKESFHWSMPFNLEDGRLSVQDDADDYTDIFAKQMLRRMAEDKNIVTLTAGTPGAIGFTPARREAAGRNFVDVGIAEQDAVSMAAGLAKGGARPVCGVMATFIQRAYDQLSQDVAINRLPAVFVDFAGSVFGIPDVTHLGFFDIPLISHIPDFIVLAPAFKEEYTAMLDWAIDQTAHPVLLRTPGGSVRSTERPVNTDFMSYDVVNRGEKIALVGAGAMFHNAAEAAEILKGKGLNPTLINPRILSHPDKKTLDSLKDCEAVVTVEDGIVDGGFGQRIAAYLAPAGIKVKCLGLDKKFLDRYNAKEVMAANNMLPEQIAAQALALL